MKRRILCPECKGNIFHYDDIHDETSCRQCGLILAGPPYSDITYPPYMIVIPYRRNWSLVIHSPMFIRTLSISYDLIE